MSTMPERIIAVIGEGKNRTTRLGEDADTHVKNLPINTDVNVVFVEKVFRKIDKHLRNKEK